MRLALIGGKQVKDFDIAQHQERKKEFGGKWVAGVGKVDDQLDDESDEEATQENEEQEKNADENPQEDE